MLTVLTVGLVGKSHLSPATDGSNDACKTAYLLPKQQPPRDVSVDLVLGVTIAA